MEVLHVFTRTFHLTLSQTNLVISLTYCSLKINFNIIFPSTPMAPKQRFSFRFFPPRSNSRPVGQGLLIIESTRSHSDTSRWVWLLWKSDQLVAVTSTWQHTTFIRDRYPCPRLDSNPQSQQASGRRTTPSTSLPLGSAFYQIMRLNP